MSQDLGALVHILSSWVLGACRASSAESKDVLYRHEGRPVGDVSCIVFKATCHMLAGGE